MKASARLIAAVMLTIPTYLGLANSPLNEWFLSGKGWRTLEPWLHFLHSLGFRSEGNMVIGTMLALSFVLAYLAIWLAARWVHHTQLHIRR